MFVAPFIGM